MLVVQGLDFFAEIPALEDQMPPARGVSDAAVVLVGHDVQRITSTAIRWLERYSQSLEENGGVFILADVNPPVMDTLRRTGALDIIGAENVIPATTKLLEAEYLAWEAAQKWIEGHIVSARPVGETPEQS